ncbi:MAG: transposase, partial [Planctomycetes bacterium]|nr:transposase [Planctomycetota bacterium]
ESAFMKTFIQKQYLGERLMKYFKFYCHERPHQSLDYRTPWEVHNSSS